MTGPPGSTGQAWRRLDCVLDDGLPLDAAIGLIANAGDTAIEPEMRNFLPRPGCETYVTRIPFEPRITPESLAAMAGSIAAATELILPDERLDVVAFGCTSAAIAIGTGEVRRLVRGIRPGVAVTDPMTASLAGMRALGLRRLAIITPYPQGVNAMIESFLAASGVEVAATGTFCAPRIGAPGRTPPSRIAPASIAEGAVAIGAGAADGIFLSCTGLRVSGVIAQIEEELGRPVVASNQALAWHALRLCGCERKVAGIGALFDRPLDA